MTAVRFGPLVVDGDLVLHDSDNNIVWRGRPLGRRVRTALAVNNSSDAIVLLEAGAGPTFRNLVRVGPDGSVRWAAALPRRDEDYYGYVGWQGSDLLATSFSSRTVTLDPDSGKILTAEFTK